MWISKRLSPLLLILALIGFTSGCETKEKILDVETPAGDVEVERDTSTGDVDVEVEGKD